MKIHRTAIPEVLLVEPRVFRDARGFFLETWHARRYQEAGIPDAFVQDNHSSSRLGTLRGLHAQVRSPQGKLVRAVRGEVYDVAVDIRRGSPTFGHHVAAHLTEENHHQLWIPPGFAHGFAVLSERADVEYKCTAFYDPEGEISVRWDDPALAIPWPLHDPILSEKDRTAPTLEALGERLPRYGEETA